ncbi:hypothetical protein RHOSPDRAFT_36862 [Rhodotorula sp. JG-1b]|nr:hypothetical protein RHOSPDRAFT_36862 [Rhodotorula sp. JG-1b]
MSCRNPERATPRRRLARPPPVRSTSPIASEATTSASAATGSSFLFSSLSGVWTSLKAAAALEVGGFVKALNGGGAPDEEEVRVQPALGDKRGRTGDTIEELSNGSHDSSLPKKRRKVRTGDDSDLLLDGVPPLMPPIAHSSWFTKRTDAGSNKSAASSPVAATALRSSTSPNSRRSSLRFSTATTTYEEELMRSTLAGTDKGLSSALAAPRSSASGSGLQPPQFSGLQSVRASSSFCGGGGGATMRKAVWRPWTVGQQLLAGAGDDAASLSPSASLLGGQTPSNSLADELAACEGQQPDLVPGQVSRGRQEEDRRVEQRRIDALEAEVRKLRDELSVQRAFKSPASAFAKAPRVSAAPPPPPPPPPPLPPIGGPHPMLLTARAKLRATPERPKRRHSTRMGGPVGVPLLAGLDMTTLMSEVGDQRQRLRKVGLPKERTQEEFRRERAAGGSGFGDVLRQRSLKLMVHRDSGSTAWSVTPLTKTAHPKPDSVSEASTITRTGTSADGSAALATPSTALTSSKSAPGEGTASQTTGGLGRGPSDGPISSTSSGVEQSSKDADAVEGADFAESEAQGTGEVEAGDDTHSHNNGAAAETVPPDSHRPETDPDQRPDPRLRAARVSITQPPSPASPQSPTAPERAMSPPIKREDSVAVCSRRRPPLPPSRAHKVLPGLEFGRSRPLTPGRQNKKQSKAQATEQGQGLPNASLSQGSDHDDADRPPLSPRLNIASSPRSPQSPRPPAKTPRRGPRRVRLPEIDSSNAQEAALEDLVAEAESTLTGRGERTPDPNRVFGRA